VCNTSVSGTDIQEIPMGHGKPNSVCIVPNTGNVLVTTSIGGDDIRFNNNNSLADYPYSTWGDDWTRLPVLDAYPLKGIPGQGNDDPPPSFNAHWVTAWEDASAGVFYYFDPSYGTSAVSSNQGEEKARKIYEDSAFAGFGSTIFNGIYRFVRKNDMSPSSPPEVVVTDN
jgi:hypothetical protein